jgi:predicted DCC family thiol-disulfide oxidoreductase YuxK
MATRPEFTLLYDGDCPLCSREVAMLRKRDRGALGLVSSGAAATRPIAGSRATGCA